MSKQEDFLAEQIKIIAPNLFFHRGFRPDFLKNEKTGKNLEIDLWFPHFKLGFEYQGAIHFNRIDRFNNDPDKSRLNDVLKQDILLSCKNNYCIIEIFEIDLKGSVKLNILNRLDNTIKFYKTKNRKYKPKIKTIDKFIKYLNYHTQITPREMNLLISKKDGENGVLLKNKYTQLCPYCNNRVDMPKIIVRNYRKGFIHNHTCPYCNEIFDFVVKLKYKAFEHKTDE